MRRDIPFLVDELEVVPQFLPAGISLFERPLFPQLLVKELIDGRIAIYSSSRIAVPIPDTSTCRAFLVDLNAEA
jgi:hypothetical protein